MAETTIKFEMDTTKCQELIKEAEEKIRGRLTIQYAMEYLQQNEEHIKWQLGADINEYKLAEVLYEYAQSLTA